MTGNRWQEKCFFLSPVTCYLSRRLKGAYMSAVVEERKIFKGGSFLIEERTSEEIFTPEDFTDEHRMIAEATREFMDNEVLPRTDDLEKKDWNLLRSMVRHAAEIGVIGASIPEE